MNDVSTNIRDEQPIHNLAFFKISNSKSHDIDSLNNKLLETVQEESFMHNFNDSVQLEYLPNNHTIRLNNYHGSTLKLTGDIVGFSLDEENDNTVMVSFLTEISPFKNDYCSFNVDFENPNSDISLTMLFLHPQTFIELFDKVIQFTDVLVNLEKDAGNITANNSDIIPEIGL